MSYLNWRELGEIRDDEIKILIRQHSDMDWVQSATYDPLNKDLRYGHGSERDMGYIGKHNLKYYEYVTLGEL
jgi:hypothetical protein